MDTRFMRTVLTVLALASLTVAAQAAWIGLDGAEYSEPRITVSDVAFGRTQVEIEVPGLAIETVMIGGQEYAQIMLPGHVQLLDHGEPMLPYLTTSLIIPDQGTPWVRILKTEYREFTTSPPEPGRGAILRSVDPATVPYEFGPAYDGGVFPAEIASVSDPYIVRDYRGASVRLFPVQWDADRGILRVLQSVTYEVVTEGQGGVNAKEPSFRPIYRTFASLYAQQFANYDNAAKYELNSAEGPMLIVCYDAFAGAMQPFIQWKMERGLEVELITTSSVGGTVAGIQNAITTRYNSPEGLAYVILVGDGPQVPHYSGAYEGANDDTRYMRLAGTDVYPDGLISRISATTAAQVATQVVKFVTYERDIVAPADWTHMGTGIASNEGSPSDITRAEWLRADLLAYNFTHIDGIYQGQGGSTAAIAAAINDGRSLVNYIGHGSGTAWNSVTFTNSNVHALTNTAWPWIIDVSCLNGGISAIGESFAEAWMRAGSEAQPHGAIGIYSASTSTPWVPPCVMQTEVVDLLCAEASQVLGVLVHGGIMKVLDTYGQSGSGLQLVEQYNLFGDCSLLVRTASPATLEVAHQPIVPLFTPTFAVNAGQPNMTVTLSGNGVIYGTGTTDESGQVVLEMIREVDTVGEVTLTVFGYNVETYRVTLLAVVPANIAIEPATVPVGETTDVTVTVTDPDTGLGMDNVMIDIRGFGFNCEPVQTDADGQVTISVTPEFGEDLLVRGQEIGESYYLFTEPLPVTGAATLTRPSVEAAVPSIGMIGSLTPHILGEVTASVREWGFTLRLQGGGLDLVEDTETNQIVVMVTPSELSPVTATLTKAGYTIYQQTIPILAAFGALAGTVVDADQGDLPLAGVRIVGFEAGADPSGTPLFDLLTAADGTYSYGEELPVGFYDLYVTKFGYLPSMETYFVLFGANDHQIAVYQAPSGMITGTVTAVEDGSPLDATIRVYRTDTGELYHTAVTDPATGEFTTTALPYFDYSLIVRSFRRIPQTRTVTVDAEVIQQDFQLEPTQGDILVLNDNSTVARFEEPKYDKHGQLMAPGYQGEPDRAAADIVTALDDLGYTVTMEAASSSDPATWTLYDLVIVSSGANTSPLTDSALRLALTAYRAAGGKLLVEGGEVAYRMQNTDSAFMNNVLKVTQWNGDNGGHVTVVDPSHYVMSVPNVITGPLSLNYTGYGAADYVTQAAAAVRVGGWTNQTTRASVICYDENPDPQGGQFVFFTFNYSTLASSRIDLLHNAINWLITPEFGNCAAAGVAQLQNQTDHAGITIRAIPGGASTVTGADGSFTLSGLYAGTYVVSASKEGWATDTVEVTLQAGETIEGLAFLLVPVVVSEHCVSPNLPIVDYQSTTSTIDLDLNATVADIAVYVDISHTYIGDLRVLLRAPSGLEVILHNRTGGSTDDIVGWYPDTLTPFESLTGMVGQQIAGTWSLVVNDLAGGDSGTFNEWCLRLTYGVSGPTPVGDEVPPVLALAGNFPNPFNPMTAIQFSVPAAQQVELAVYDVRGQKVCTLLRDVVPAGSHTVTWRGHDDAGRQVASGTYFYRMTTDGQSLVKKMMLLK
ncbi:MAG: C25 family cysteine peptidase [Candidatus Krumholzibacteria bacterium]|nr:C25 family cysteine peptidase [Candidatus Krumholzibacteria bacterium]